MGKRIILNKEQLIQKYVVEGLSKKDSAKFFNVSVDTVARNLKEYDIPSHKPKDWNTHKDEIILTTTQKDILYGALLGDGCLNLHKNGINAIFSYTSKSLQHVEYVCSSFTKYSNTKIRCSTIFDKRTNKEYSRHTFRTITNLCWTKYYNIWYKNGVKHIPKDLKLNSLICKIWYLGDGGIIRSKRSYYIKLATQCFNKSELEEIIIPQLKEFNAHLTKADVGKDGIEQFFIYIPRKEVIKFLNYIGECPFEDYQYKWDATPYKNKIPKTHKSNEKLFCEMYKNGMTYYSIAKCFNIEPNAVKYYLIKNNLYRKGGIYNDVKLG